MKKYIKPAIIEVQLENEAILAASNPSLRFGNGTTDYMEADELDLDWDEE